MVACEAPTAPEESLEVAPSFDIANSGNENAAFLVRANGVCGVYTDADQSDISNFDAKYYVTTTSSGVLNLNCTGATLKPEQIPAKSYTFELEFSGLSCKNRILKSGIAHSNCHGKP
jgi:hypothetical protein